MTREELEHAIRAACDVSGEDEVYVFGSQAILGQYPNAHPDLTMSAEADIAPINNEDNSDLIDGALGADSRFHETNGFYVQGVSIGTAIVSKGWEKRCIKVASPATNGKVGRCLEGHDLALAKLAAYRDKDKEFVRVLLREKLVQPERLLKLLKKLPVARDLREKIHKWIESTVAELRAARKTRSGVG